MPTQSPTLNQLEALDYWVKLPPPRSLSRMALLCKLAAIPAQWINWSKEDDWPRMAEEFDRAAVSDRIRRNWEEFELTQTDVLRISKKLLEQIDILAEPLTKTEDDEAHNKLTRRRARESEGLQCVAEALQRVTKVRLMVLEGLARPQSQEEDNPTHLKAKVPLWMGTTDAAKYFGVTAHSLRAWIKKGRITTIITPGGQRRYDVNSIPDDIPPITNAGNLKRGGIHQHKKKEPKANATD